MDEELLEDIYLTLQGLLTKEAQENAFETGSLCEREYSRMRDAYERACIRMGVDVDDGDPDLSQMVRSMEKIQDTLCREMFLLGMRYQKMER